MAGGDPLAVAVTYFAYRTSAVTTVGTTVMVGYCCWKAPAICLNSGSRVASQGCQTSSVAGAVLLDGCPADPGAHAAGTAPTAPTAPSRMRLRPRRPNGAGPVCIVSTPSPPGARRGRANTPSSARTRSDRYRRLLPGAAGGARLQRVLAARQREGD